ncbi:hypothetical protein AN958_06480 [Leucoagaricus sp. SymC.cos]|nr:hypothetical protein AN958_06480 [Leucoagaricus sp. SymC.cos]
MQSLTSLRKRNAIPPHHLAAASAEAHIHFAHETKRLWVGPMPVEDFLNDFFPSKRSILTTAKHNQAHISLRKIPDRQGTLERDMYRPLLVTLKGLGLGNLSFHNTSTQRDGNSPDNKQGRPDLSTYLSTEWHDDDPGDRSYGSNSLPAATSFYHQVLPFEVKRGTQDPFTDPAVNAPFEDLLAHDYESGPKDIRGQIASILSEMMSHSFRTHAFSVFINARIIRLIRADRAGIIVTRAIHYREDPVLFFDFLSRFDQSSPEDLGRDITVQTAGAPWSYTILVPNSVSQQASSAPILDQARAVSYVLETQESNNYPDYEKVWTQDNIPELNSLISRGRRIIEVSDANDSPQHYVLKDTWVLRKENGFYEVDALREMQEKGVRNIPHLEAGGDVEGRWHQTQTQLYATAAWRAGPRDHITCKIHHRLLMRPAGRPLATFTKARELVQALHDVLIALQDAYELCNLIHGDISVNNVLINGDGEGVLIDWEYAKKEGTDIDDTLPGRTGTWYFMSIRLLSYHKIQDYTHSDDIEGVYWVLAFLAYNDLNHNKTSPRETCLILRSFQECEVDQVLKRDVGGSGKWLEVSGHTIETRFDGNPALTDMCQVLQKLLRRFYDDYAPFRNDDNPPWLLEVPPTLPIPTLNIDTFIDAFVAACNRDDTNWSEKLSQFKWLDQASEGPKPKEVAVHSQSTRSTRSRGRSGGSKGSSMDRR